MPETQAQAIKSFKKSRNILLVHFDNIGSGWEKWILLTSDRHFDARDCDRELQIRHMEQCRSRGGHIIDVGDLFDCMQGRYDPRRCFPDMREEYAQAMIREQKSYLDLVVADAAKFYAPYADMFLVVGRGNHETSIAKHNDTDLTDRLVCELNKQPGANIQTGGYGGWVKFFFSIYKTQHDSMSLKYFHGSGGGGPVTRGVIQTNRQAVYLPDADIVVNGHTHDAWVVPIERERLSKNGDQYQDTQWHVRTPTYNNDYGDGSGGWFVETGKAPRPRGGVWLHFVYQDPHIKVTPVIDIE